MMYSDNNLKELRIEISYKAGGKIYGSEVFIPYNELLTEENHKLWQDYLCKKIPELINESALNTPEYQACVEREEQRRKWEEERKIREEKHAYSKLLHDSLTYIPLGRNLDYEHYYHDYIAKILQWKFRDEEEYSYLMQRLKRWAGKTCPKHIEKGRPDVAYAIAKCFFINLHHFLNREDVSLKLQDNNQKAKINKIIRLLFEALSQAVVKWNHEAKRQELTALLDEQVSRHPLIQKQAKKLILMLPKTPLLGNPTTITYQLTAAEKRLGAEKAARLRYEQLRKEEEIHERNALIKYNPECEELMECGKYDPDGFMLATMIRAQYSYDLKRMIADGKTQEAVYSFLQLLKSLCKHFVADEHYNYFDDMYSPDYECSNLYKLILEHLKSHPNTEAEDLLHKGLDEIRQMESYTNYGVPSLCFERDVHTESNC